MSGSFLSSGTKVFNFSIRPGCTMKYSCMYAVTKIHMKTKKGRNGTSLLPSSTNKLLKKHSLASCTAMKLINITTLIVKK